MAAHHLTAIVKEDAHGKPFLMLEPGSRFLEFRRPATFQGAHSTAEWLREMFDIGAITYRPPPIAPADDFEPWRLPTG